MRSAGSRSRTGFSTAGFTVENGAIRRRRDTINPARQSATPATSRPRGDTRKGRLPMGYEATEKERAYHREYKQMRRANPAYRAKEKVWGERYQETLEVRQRRLVSARKRNNQRRLWQRVLALDYYGGCCACCGEDRDYFLAIDHIDGGGGKHRKETKAQHIAEWLFDNGWSNGFQVLCHNGNVAKYRFGEWP